ncbi:amidase [Halobacteriales archaeon QS_8_69_26]|nr:MAG: amidase [Halobacteriales archaeon QS_8_69_26]
MVSEVRAGELARRLRRGETDPATVLDRTRERFEAVDPSVCAFVEEEDRWGRLERELDRRRDPGPGERPPLYGLPVGVKDVFHVDGFETRGGSEVPPTAIDGPESPAVAALEDAGALVLGKTVTAEFAYFEPGPTRNPHDTDHTPGGSSSGSAAAVAAGVCPLALGTQTIGSVNRPAAFCGVVGVKPSYGRIPTDGVLPAAPSVDTVGFFTADLPGATLAAGVLCEDWRAGDEPPDPPVVGAVEGPYLDQASDVGREHFAASVDLIAGEFEVRRPDPFSDVDAVNERHNRLVAAEMALSHDELYPDYRDRYADATREIVERGRGIDVGSLCDARAGRRELRTSVHEAMDEAGVDVLVSPAAPGPAPEGIDSTGDPVMNLPWTHAGVPAVTVPASTTDGGLPIGLQCTARFGDDEWLLRWCRGIRSALDG